MGNLTMHPVFFDIFDKFAPALELQESQDETTATRQMEAEGCPSLPDLLPLVVPQQPINTLEALPF